MTTDNSSMESVSHEDRKFPPSSEFVDAAHISGDKAYRALYEKSIQDPEAFWAEAAGELHWFKKWDTVLDDANAPFFKCFDVKGRIFRIFILDIPSARHINNNN